MEKHENTSLENRPTNLSDGAFDTEAEKARSASRSVGGASIWLNLIVLWAALGVFSNAYNVAIIASSLGQPTFAARFGFATQPDLNALISGAVGGNQAGGFIGQFIMAYFSERFGRRITIGICCVVLIIGIALSGGSVNGSWGMFIASRVIIGMGGWPLASLALTYQSEVAIAELRGWLTGTVGLAFGLGYTLAAWVGVGLFYYNTDFAWRLPLILGLIWPLLCLACLPFVPETPRWLCLHGRHEEAYEIIKRMHSDSADPLHVYAKNEFAEVKAQAAHDATLDSSWGAIFKTRPNVKRFWVTVLVAAAGQNTAIQVVTSYGPQLYAGYGFSAGNSLLLAGGWITIAAIEPLACMAVLDKIGRRPLIVAASFLCTFTLLFIGVLSKYFGTPTGTITAGGGAIIAFIYLHIVCYLLCEAADYVYFGEIWPSHLRAKGAAIGLATIQLTAVWLVFATPYALANIGWKFYMVFVALNAVGAVLTYLYVPETKLIPLEEVAALFGDEADVQMHLQDIRRDKERFAREMGVDDTKMQ